MNLSKIFTPELISLGKKFSNKEEALKTVAKMAVTSPASEGVTEEQIFDALKARENIYSTGFGNGVAIPHCKIEGVKDFVTGVITIPDGVDFEAEDCLDVKLIIFIIGPVSKSNEHIRLLSLISQKLHDKEFTEEILNETAPEKIPGYFITKDNCPLATTGHGSRDIMHIIVQDEEWFNEILQIISGVDTSQVVVIDAQYEGQYLARIPIFSNVWSNQEHSFCKMIYAVLEKEVTGSIVKGIDNLVDGLDKCDRVLITIQHAFYSAGSLQF